MIKIAICDDEREDRKKLHSIIREFMDSNSKKFILKEFVSGEQFLENKFEPDILFLDIMMKEKDGIQVGNELKRYNPNMIIIYITNLKEKISIAINQIHAFGYLEKPISRENVFALLFDALNCFKQDIRASKVTFLSENKAIVELSASDIYFLNMFSGKSI